MDRKTLEYMEKRAREARLIVNTIEELRTNIVSIKRVEKVKFQDYRNTPLFDASTGALTNEMKESYIQIAEKEIVSLEQKLAEL